MNTLRQIATLEELGSEVTRAEFLGLTPEDEAAIAIRLAMHRKLRELRQRSGLTQTQLAEKIGSSQSRVAKAETGDKTVSFDLLLRAMLATGASPQEIGETIGEAVEPELAQA